MNSNEIIQNKIHLALQQDASVASNKIGVTVKHGVVTLYGTLDKYSEKTHVIDIVKGIKGVAALADEITVTNHVAPLATERISELTHTIRQRCPYVQDLNIVLDGNALTIEGVVNDPHQKELITEIVAGPKYFSSVNNLIKVRSETIKPQHSAIVRALNAKALLDASHIEVSIDQNDVRLTGFVSTLLEKELAQYTVQTAPGVLQVHNDLRIIHELSENPNV